LPLASTVPIPWLIEIWFALVTDHRSVEAWPRSTELGSATNSVIVGAAGGAGATTGAGAGGGGGAAFFLQPAVNNTSRIPSPRTFQIRLFSINFASRDF
jgi:hypothetical protein